MTPLPAQTAARRGIPDATLARLPDYLRALTELLRSGTDTVSSVELAAAAGVNPTQVRRDLSYLGSHGVRGVGYGVALLAAEVARCLGTDRAPAVLVVGAGRLGQALAQYPGLTESGLAVTALYDHDPQVVGTTVGALVVRDIARLPQDAADLGAVIGVITTPAASAQHVCDTLIDAGVRSILTFAPGPLTTRAGADVRRVDVAAELQVLAVRARAVHRADRWEANTP